MLKRKTPVYLEAGIANDEILRVNATPISAKWKSGAAVPVPLQRQAKHYEVPSGQDFAPREASKIRMHLSGQLQGLRAARSGTTDCSNKLGTLRRSSPMIVGRCYASDGKYFKEARRNCTIFDVRQASAVRSRKHEELVLLDGSGNLPGKACGWVSSTILCRRHNSSVRNACIRVYHAMGGPRSSHTRRIRHRAHAGEQQTTRPEICQRSCKSAAFYRPSPTVVMTGPSNSSKLKLIQVNLAKGLIMDLSDSVRIIKSLIVFQALSRSLE